MSLMRLLSEGRTLMGIRESHGRYRVDSSYRLPKFGSAKNPFVSSSEAKPAAQTELPMSPPIEKALEEKAAEVEKVVLAPKEIVAMNVKETGSVTAVAECQSANPPAPMETPVVEEKLHPILALLDWMELTAIRFRALAMNLNLRKVNFAKINFSKLNPAKLMPKRNVFSVPVTARPSETPVQAELSLEKVRVVRNDLSDADLEIVPLKAQTKPARREKAKPEQIAERELAGVEA